ncbi:MAG: hypothetical protein U0M12_07920 [Acutalibacteraceae bacterium]|nr:hypothetical protein [Acutalibacteraceae bacterium]
MGKSIEPLNPCPMCNSLVETEYLENKRYRYKCKECGLCIDFDAPSQLVADKIYNRIITGNLFKNKEPTDSMCVEEKIGYSILHGEVKINELCFAERTGNRAYYIYSFRYCRDCKNEEEYQQTLELLHSDINRLPNGRLREALEEVYNNYYDYKYYLKCKMM